MRIGFRLRRGLAFAAALLVPLATTSCGSGAAPAAAPADAGQAGALTVAVPQDAADMDPLHTYPYGAADGNRMAALYDVLVWSDPATGAVQPQLADSLTAGDNGRTWTLRLHRDIRFSDRTPLDAEAVRFNWERHRDANNHSLQLAATADIVSLQVIDPVTLQVRLKRPNANFDRIVARNLSFIGSPTAIRQDPSGIGRKPVGAGPYLLSEWTSGRQVFTRNPDYWLRDRGLPHFQQLTMVVDTEPAHAVDEIAADRLDMSVVFAPDAIAHAADRRLTVRQIHLDGGAMMVFNMAAKPFSDPRVRQAAVLALSGAEINKRFSQGAGTQARGVFAATSPVANTQLTAPENNSAQARALFAELTDNGRRQIPFIMVVPRSSALTKVAEYIRDTVNQYPGIAAQVQVADSADYIRTVRKGDWDWHAALTQQWFADPEPGLYDLLYSTSTANLGSWSNPAADKALDTARGSGDPTARRDAYTALQVEMNRELPVWVFQESVATAVFPRGIADVQLCNDGIVLWDRVSRQL